MKPITVYEADDGSRWDAPEDASKRDALLVECKAFIRSIPLAPTPDTTDFGNGHGYVQQPKGARDQMIAFLKSKGTNRDSGGPLGKLLYRARCIDGEGREWGQPYFAANPHKSPFREPVTA